MTPVRTRARETGSALVVAVLVIAILTLLGVSFLLMAETENRIAENERLSAQALYFTEAAARAAIQWFDHPGSPSNLANPTPAQVDRTLRRFAFDENGDPITPPQLQDGSTWPRYKQDTDDLFDKPYRPDRNDTLLGTEDEPDLRIDRAAGGAQRDFLDALSETLVEGYPAPEAGIRARIRSIDIYAPPYVRIAGYWTRFGIATVKVVGQIVRTSGATERVLAERMVKAVLNEIPYNLPYGPIHSCGGFDLANQFSAHWGTATGGGVADLALDEDHTKLPASLPRLIPPGVKIDLLWGWNDDAAFADYKSAIEGLRVEDPWFRFLNRGEILGSGTTTDQPFPFNWDRSFPIPPEWYPSHDGGAFGDHSNLFQNMPLVGCPEYDYDLWKSIATSGREGVNYYAWDTGAFFRKDGVGPSLSFRAITDVDPSDPAAKPGLFFFDTKDGLAPHDDNADGHYENLTPITEVGGTTWGPRGFFYLNMDSLRTTALIGRPSTVQAPGEPFQDANENGRRDTGENWINLKYPEGPTANLTDLIYAVADWPLGAAVWDDRGPPLTENVVIEGIVYTNGRFDISGSSIHYGSIIAREGVWQSNIAAGRPDIYWDERIGRGAWPPSGWNLPRVMVSSWETDL